MSESAWLPCAKEPLGQRIRLLPCYDLVKHTPLAHCPGARLTRDLQAVTDSLGNTTEFFLVDGSAIYARCVGVDMRVTWLAGVILPFEDLVKLCRAK